MAFASPIDDSQTCHTTVTGRVVDGTSGESVPQVRVQPGDDAARAVETDDEGRFQLTGVCPGTTRVTLERPDYETTTRSITSTEADGRLAVDWVIEPRTVEALDDVVVEAPALTPTELRSAQTLDGEALDETRGRNLADSIAKVPGVSVLRSSTGTMGKPIIRGQFGRRNLILYDGIRHEGQRWGIDHAPEVDPFSAGSITVIKGAGGIRYGPDAIGGVVLIDPPPLREDPGIEGEAHLIGISNGLRGTAALRVDGAPEKVPGFSWRVEGNVTRGRALMTPEYPLDNTGSFLWNVGGKLGYSHDVFDIEVGYKRHFMRAGICTCIRISNEREFEQSIELGRPVNSDLYNAEFEIERPYQRVVHDLVLTRSRVRLGGAGDLVATYAFQDNDREEYDQVREGVEGPQLEFDLQTHSAELAFEHAAVDVSPRAALEGTYGVAFMRQVNEFESNNTLIPDYEQYSGGVFGIERLVMERFELELGGRYDGLTRTATLSERDYLGQVGTDRLDPDRCTRTDDDGGRCSFDFHTGSGSVGALVRPVKRVPEFTIKTDLTSAARFPAIDEQFLNGTAPSFPVLGFGDTEIGVERTWGGSLTLGYANTWMATEASAYGNYIDEYIYFVPEPVEGPCEPLNCTSRGPFQVFAFKPVDAVFYGGEVGFDVRPQTWPVELDGQISIVRGVQARDGAPLVFVPTDRYQLGVTYWWPDVWKLERGHVGLEGTFVDRKRDFEPDVDFADPPPAYFLLGAKAGVELPIEKQVVAFALVGSNLLNARYRDYTSLLRYFADEPGWELLARVTVRFEASK